MNNKKKNNNPTPKKQTVRDKIAQMDDVYCWAYQEGEMDKEELISVLNEILLESVHPKIRDYYNWIMQGL